MCILLSILILPITFIILLVKEFKKPKSNNSTFNTINIDLD